MPGKGGGTRKRGRDPFKICSLRVSPLHTCASLLREKSVNHSKNGPFQGGEEAGDITKLGLGRARVMGIQLSARWGIYLSSVVYIDHYTQCFHDNTDTFTWCITTVCGSITLLDVPLLTCLVNSGVSNAFNLLDTPFSSMALLLYNNTYNKELNAKK